MIDNEFKSHISAVWFFTMNTMFATLEPLKSIGEMMSSGFQISTREDRGTTWIKVLYCKGQTIQNSPWSVAVYNLQFKGYSYGTRELWIGACPPPQTPSTHKHTYTILTFYIVCSISKSYKTCSTQQIFAAKIFLQQDCEFAPFTMSRSSGLKLRWIRKRHERTNKDTVILTKWQVRPETNVKLVCQLNHVSCIMLKHKKCNNVK